MFLMSTRTIILSFCIFLLSGNVHATQLTISTDNAPPHVIELTRGGIDLDITMAVLSKMGHTATVQFMPLSRGKQQVINKKSDLFLPTFFEKDTDELFISDAIIDYRPTFFTRVKDDFVVRNVADLANKRIVTFQGASKYFGPEFLAMTKRNKSYRELHSMTMLPELLLKGRYDVVLLDYYIFYYFLESRRAIDIAEHVIFPTVNAHVEFHSQNLRDEFNVDLAAFKQKAEYQNIIDSYLSL